MKLLTVTQGPTWPGNAPLPEVGTSVGSVIFRPVSRVASGTGTTIGESVARLVVAAGGTVELRGTDSAPFRLWGGVPADGSVEAPIYDVEEYLHLYVGTPQERAAPQYFRIQPYETVGDGIPEGTWDYRTVPEKAVRYVAGPDILQAFEDVRGGRVILGDAEAARQALLDGATGLAALTALVQPALDEIDTAAAAALAVTGIDPRYISETTADPIPGDVVGRKGSKLNTRGERVRVEWNGAGWPVVGSPVTTRAALTRYANSLAPGYGMTEEEFLDRGLQPRFQATAYDLGVRLTGGNNSAQFATLMLRSQDAGGMHVLLDKGEFGIDLVDVTPGLFLQGHGRGSVLRQGSSSYRALGYGMDSVADAAGANNLKFVTLADFAVRGRADTESFDEHHHALAFSGVEHLVLRRLTVTGNKGDAVYLGSGIGVEKHNRHVLIEDLWVDGLNNNNRNGVSIIDGTNVQIVRPRMFNVTAPNMPGPVDVEPNGNPYHVVRDITVSDGYFENCGGNGGVLSVVVPAEVSERPRNIRLVGGAVKNKLSGQILLVNSLAPVTAATPDMHLRVSGVRVTASPNAAPFSLFGATDVTLSDNDWTDVGIAARIGYYGSVGNRDIRVTDRFTRSMTSGDGCFQLGADLDGLDLSGSTFTDCGIGGGAAFGLIRVNAGATLRRYQRRRTVVRNPNGKNLRLSIIEAARSVVIGGVNTAFPDGVVVAANSEQSGNEEPAGLLDPVGAAIKAAAVATSAIPKTSHSQASDVNAAAFNPSTFPIGPSYTTLNIATNLPGGATSGVINTFIDTTFGPDGIGFSWQTLGKRGGVGTPGAWIRFPASTAAGSGWGPWISTTTQQITASSIDLPSIAPGATYTTAETTAFYAVPGAVLVPDPSQFPPGITCRVVPTNTDKVTLDITNGSAAAYDAAAKNYVFRQLR